MKAILLAAGAGTRLRPLTNQMPKCLVPLGGVALLELWLNKLARARVTDVLINGHAFAEQVEAHIESVRSRFPFKLHFVREEHLRGTGGTLIDNRRYTDSTDELLVCHADNYTDMDLGCFAQFHRRCAQPLSLALFRTDNPSSCGIVEEIDGRGIIQRFVEKPSHSESNLASAAIFLMQPTVIDRLVPGPSVDFSKQLLPRMQGQMAGFVMRGFNIDVGTPESYARACELAAARLQLGTAEFGLPTTLPGPATTENTDPHAAQAGPIPKAALPSRAARTPSKY